MLGRARPPSKFLIIKDSVFDVFTFSKSSKKIVNFQENLFLLTKRVVANSMKENCNLTRFKNLSELRIIRFCGLTSVNYLDPIKEWQSKIQRKLVGTYAETLNH